jgi:glutamate synthase (NADPH/NADH) small chain
LNSPGNPGKKPVEERRGHYYEFIERYSEEKLNQQAAVHGLRRTFCHHGCPLGNIIPEFNDAVS